MKQACVMGVNCDDFIDFSEGSHGSERSDLTDGSE